MDKINSREFTPDELLDALLRDKPRHVGDIYQWEGGLYQELEREHVRLCDSDFIEPIIRRLAIEQEVVDVARQLMTFLFEEIPSLKMKEKTFAALCKLDLLVGLIERHRQSAEDSR